MVMNDDLLSSFVSFLSSANEDTLVLRLKQVRDPAYAELVAVAALMVTNTRIRVAALELLAAHGGAHTLDALRALTCNGDVDVQVRAAAERAHAAITSRAISSSFQAATPSKQLKAS